MEAFLSMFREASITKLITPENAFPYVGKLQEQLSLQRLIIPELDILLDKTAVTAIPFTKTFEEYRMKPWVLLHTSG